MNASGSREPGWAQECRRRTSSVAAGTWVFLLRCQCQYLIPVTVTGSPTNQAL
jgi:hypothetical protein